jgi:hypothetical protein
MPKEQERSQRQAYNRGITDVLNTIKDPEARLKIFQASLLFHLEQQQQGSEDEAREENIRQLIRVNEDQLTQIEESARHEKKKKKKKKEEVEERRTQTHNQEAQHTQPDPSRQLWFYQETLKGLRLSNSANGPNSFLDDMTKKRETEIEDLERQIRELQDRKRKEKEEEEASQKAKELYEKKRAHRARRKQEILIKKRKKEQDEREERERRAQQHCIERKARRKGKPEQAPLES